MGAFSKGPYNLHRKSQKSNPLFEKESRWNGWTSKPSAGRWQKEGEPSARSDAGRTGCHVRPNERGELYSTTHSWKSQALCTEITETRETAKIRATFEREHEVERGRKAPANRPKTRNFGLPRKYHGVEKTDLEKCDKVLLGGLCSMARGRTPPDRQSFRGCPNDLLFAV